jgi:hypothetical protein
MKTLKCEECGKKFTGTYASQARAAHKRTSHKAVAQIPVNGSNPATNSANGTETSLTLQAHLYIAQKSNDSEIADLEAEAAKLENIHSRIDALKRENEIIANTLLSLGATHTQ